MHKELTLQSLVEKLKEQLEGFPDARTGQNMQYELVDAGLEAFSVFFTQSSSFLSRQEDLKRRKGRSNAESLFGLSRVPSDNQIRSMLDAVVSYELHRVGT